MILPTWDSMPGRAGEITNALFGKKEKKPESVYSLVLFLRYVVKQLVF